ncbi:RNA polymerase sigma factor [Paenibacillus sp. MSJ-34]|uniref:RNA polymerase sigma factor n=1 Tax=Paenibacillus sp. MSJ-34 TaxID=2841529 RepID=UPI00345FFC4F
MENRISMEEAERLFAEYSLFVFRSAYVLTKSKSLADDITQETFIKIYMKIGTLDRTKPIRPWIYKIMLNTARNMLRKQKWLVLIGQVPETEDEVPVEETVLRDEASEELLREIERLPHKSKEIIMLHFYGELKLYEIAEILNIPIGTCKSRLNRALMSLRNRLPRSNVYGFTKRGELYGEK